MKESDLMSGDLVSVNGIPVKVINVIGDEVKVSYFNEDESVYTYLACSLDPILITPEFLEKNRFKLTLYEPRLGEDSNKGYCYHDEEMLLDVMPVSLKNNEQVDFYHICFVSRHSGSIQVRPIRFAHQIQRALKLCGISKEIEPLTSDYGHAEQNPSQNI